MTLPVFQATIVNGSGDIIPTPQITVLEEPLGTPATLFSDRDGLVPLGINGVFSGDIEGFAQFFAAAGNYRVTAFDSGSGFTKTWDFVVLTGTAGTADVQTNPTDETAGRALLTDSVIGNDGLINRGSYGGKTAVIIGDTAFARTVTDLRTVLNHSVAGDNFDIVKGAGSYSIIDMNNVFIDTVLPANIGIISAGPKSVFIECSGVSALTLDKPYQIICDGATSTIDVVKI
jgi:hypothetical protein